MNYCQEQKFLTAMKRLKTFIYNDKVVIKLIRRASEIVAKISVSLCKQATMRIRRLN